MKVVDIETYAVGNPWKAWLFVRVMTDEGIWGIGEGTLGHFTRAVQGAIEDMKPFVVGLSPFEVERLVHTVNRDMYADGGQIKMAALSAIESAFWDIIGKATNQPVYQLLGGACHERLRVYANGWYRDERSPEAFARRAKEVVARGYTGLKFDPFGTGWRVLTPYEEDLSIDIVAAVRDAVGPHVDLMIEGHSRFDVSTAVRIGKRLEPFRPAWFEEPVPHHNVQAIVEAARRMPVPVATGESISSKYHMAELLQSHAIHIINFEPFCVGGILASRKIADMVDAHYGVVTLHAAAGPLSSLICAHIHACTPNYYIQEYFDEFNESWQGSLLTQNLRFEDGYLHLPGGPGLGADLNLDAVRAHPWTGRVDMNLFQADWHRRGSTASKSS